MAAITFTEIKLTSTLGKKYGRSHKVHLSTKTPAEALRWLFSQFPATRQYFATAHHKGVQFAIFRGRGERRENLKREQLDQPAGDCITIAPVHVGAKNGGVLQTILGIVLIVVGAYISEYDGGTTMGVGISMVAGGVAQMLSPHPKLNKSADSAGNQASYVFNGPTNTTAQGNCVPVVYGRVRAGSAVISAGIHAEDYVPSTPGVGVGTWGGNLKKSPYDMH